MAGWSDGMNTYNSGYDDPSRGYGNGPLGAGINAINNPGPQAPKIPDFVPYTGGGYDVFGGGSAASKLRDYATGKAASPWLALAQQRNKLTDLTDRDKVMGQGQAGATMAADNLAMQGGLTSGAMERTQEGASQGIMDRLQDVGRNTNERDLDLSIAAGKDQEQQLGQVAGIEANQGMFNTNLMAQNNRALNDYNLNKYGIQGQIYGNDKLAKATADQGGSSWVCTEVGKAKPHTLSQKAALEQLAAHGMHVAPRLTHLYLTGFRRTIKRMKKHGVKFGDYRAFIDQICHLIQGGRIDSAFMLYVLRMRDFAQEFDPLMADKIERILTSEEF